MSKLLHVTKMLTYGMLAFIGLCLAAGDSTGQSLALVIAAKVAAGALMVIAGSAFVAEAKEEIAREGDEL